MHLLPLLTMLRTVYRDSRARWASAGAAIGVAAVELGLHEPVMAIAARLFAA